MSNAWRLRPASSLRHFHCAQDQPRLAVIRNLKKIAEMLESHASEAGVVGGLNPVSKQVVESDSSFSSIGRTAFGGNISLPDLMPAKQWECQIEHTGQGFRN